MSNAIGSTDIRLSAMTAALVYYDSHLKDSSRVHYVVPEEVLEPLRNQLPNFQSAKLAPFRKGTIVGLAPDFAAATYAVIFGASNVHGAQGEVFVVFNFGPDSATALVVRLISKDGLWKAVSVDVHAST